MSLPVPPDAGSHRAAARSASPVALAGVGVNVVVAATTLAVARALTSREYGTFVQLVAVFYVLSMPGLALGVAVVRRVSAWLARPATHTGPDTLDAWITRVRRQVWFGAAAFFVLGAAVAYPLSRLLVIRSPVGLIETFAAAGLWTALCFERALLQAHQGYRPYAANLAIEGVLRCGVTIAAVVAGLGVPGAVAGLLISLPAALVHARRAQRPLDTRVAPDAAATPAEASRARHDALLALAALGLLAVLQNIDVLILGRQVPASSGSYGAVSVACKALVLIAFVLAGFLLPETATNKAAGRHALGPLYVSLGFVAVPAVILLIAAKAAGRSILSLVFGARLTGAADAFLPLAIAMTLLAAAVMLTHYLLAAGSRTVNAILLVGAVATTATLELVGTTPTRLAWADAGGQAVVLLALTGLVALQHRSAASR